MSYQFFSEGPFEWSQWKPENQSYQIPFPWSCLKINLAQTEPNYTWIAFPPQSNVQVVPVAHIPLGLELLGMLHDRDSSICSTIGRIYSCLTPFVWNQKNDFALPFSLLKPSCRDCNVWKPLSVPKKKLKMSTWNVSALNSKMVAYRAKGSMEIVEVAWLKGVLEVLILRRVDLQSI